MEKADKTRIHDRLLVAMQREDLSNNEASEILGVRPCILSSAKNPFSWYKCSKRHWETLGQWERSGLTLRDWGAKFGYSPAMTFDRMRLVLKSHRELDLMFADVMVSGNWAEVSNYISLLHSKVRKYHELMRQVASAVDSVDVNTNP